MIGRLTLLLSRELDQALGAVEKVARAISKSDLFDVALEATPEEVEGPLGVFYELSDQVSRACAKHPQEAKRLRDMLRAIEELAQESSDPSFHPALHTFQSMCRGISAIQTDSKALKRTIDHYSRNFERAISGEFAWPNDDLEGDRNKTKDWHLSRTEADKIRNSKVKLRAQEITQPDFIKRIALPYVSGRPSDGGAQDLKATIVREIDSGRATVRYHCGGKALVFGKLYSDESQAQHGFQVQSDLWNLGFDGHEPCQVPEPLAYLPQYRLVLIKAVEGRQLSTLFNEQDPEFPTYARQAARWLVKLHRSPLRAGKGETLWQSMWFCKILRRLSKVSAAAPDCQHELVGMVRRLCEQGKRNFKDLRPVQAHGTFHYEHVLVDGPTTSVIDFDKSFPSDPAKDLAEFLNVLRWRSFQLTGSVRLAEQPTRAFLEEYLHYLPENSANLPLHWGAKALGTFFRQVKHHRQDDSYDVKVQFLSDEFDSILSREAFVEIGGWAN